MPNHSHAHVSLAGESVAALLARLPWATFLFSSALGLLLQYLMASTYSGLIVESFGGARSAQVMGAGDVALAYVITLLTAGVCGVYCAKRTGPSRVIVLIHLVAVVIPLQALVAADFELARSEFAAAVGLCLLAAMALALWLDDWQLPEVSSISRMVAIVLALLLSGYVYGALVLQGGLGRISFDLNLVYEVREEYLEEAAPLFGYLVPWQGYVLNPSLLLLGFRRRSLLLMLLGLGLQVGLFAMTGFRAFLLSPIMMFGLYWVGTRRQLVPLAMLAAMAVIVISELIYTITNEPLIPSLLVYRLLLIPAELHFWYYDFFGVHAQPLLLLSQSVLSAVSEQHYSAPIAEVIGWKYMGSAASANVGLFGDAFANFGFAGCAAFAMLLALTLKVIDAAGSRTNPRLAAGLVGVPAFQLVNSGLQTTLVTHGLILTMIALWILSEPGRRAGLEGSA